MWKGLVAMALLMSLPHVEWSGCHDVGDVTVSCGHTASIGNEANKLMIMRSISASLHHPKLKGRAVTFYSIIVLNM